MSFSSTFCSGCGIFERMRFIRRRRRIADNGNSCSSHAIQADPYYFTSGLRIMGKDENDLPFRSPDFRSKNSEAGDETDRFFGGEYAYPDTADMVISSSFPALCLPLRKFLYSESGAVFRNGILPLLKYDKKKEYIYEIHIRS